MSPKKPSKKELEKLAEQISQDQKKDAPAEKRVKVGVTFKKAVKKMARTKSPKSKSD